MSPTDRIARITARLASRAEYKQRRAELAALTPEERARRVRKNLKALDGRPNERAITKEIRNWAERTEGFELWRNSVGGFISPNTGRHVAFGVGGKGGSDFVGIVRGARFVAIEVKSAIGELRPGQREFLERVNELGGYGVVVRSLEGAKRAIEAAAAGELALVLDPERELAKAA